MMIMMMMLMMMVVVISGGGAKVCNAVLRGPGPFHSLVSV